MARGSASRRSIAADHAGRRTHRAELHAQLAHARESRPPAAVRSRASMWRSVVAAGAGACRPGWWCPHTPSTGGLLLAAGVLQAVAACALGRRSHARRSAGAGAARRLRLRSARLPADSARRSCGRRHSPQAPGSTPGRPARSGMMTLAVMTRASLGHTGQPARGRPGTQAIYAGALVAVLTRIVAAFSPDVVLLHIAALRLGGGVRRLRCRLRPAARARAARVSPTRNPATPPACTQRIGHVAELAHPLLKRGQHSSTPSRPARDSAASPSTICSLVPTIGSRPSPAMKASCSALHPLRGERRAD